MVADKGRKAAIGAPPLLDTCLETLADNIQKVDSLVGIPEELAVVLFERILRKSKLNPRVVQLFQETGHEVLDQLMSALNIQPLPAVLPTSCTTSRLNWM